MRQGAERRIYRRLNDEAMRRRSAAGTLIAAISNKETAFNSAFFPDADPTQTEVDEVALFDNVSRSLGELVSQIRVGGSVTYAFENPHQEPGSDDPWVQVGWVKHVATVAYGSGEHAIVPHKRALTEEGLMVINHWLHQLGEETL